MEEIRSNWIPGMGMSAMALELTEEQTDDMVLDLLEELRSRLDAEAEEIRGGMNR